MSIFVDACCQITISRSLDSEAPEDGGDEAEDEAEDRQPQYKAREMRVSLMLMFYSRCSLITRPGRDLGGSWASPWARWPDWSRSAARVGGECHESRLSDNNCQALNQPTPDPTPTRPNKFQTPIYGLDLIGPRSSFDLGSGMGCFLVAKGKYLNVWINWWLVEVDCNDFSVQTRSHNTAF